ncbi:MAG TPA: TadE/TadG family type IV pilus assembly protein [Polyangia bacterium]|nr:TadE/TadG family type IV pilus assembly protein [Polyangia bacterium]
MVVRDRLGAAYVEFLVVIGPFLVLVLGLTQLGLLFGADLLVAHAAGKAARAAIVILPDDHEDADYGGVPVNQVGLGGEGLGAYMLAPSGGRLAAIRDAARLTLSPIGPSLDSVNPGSVAGALIQPSGVSLLSGLIGWTALAVAVSFPDGEGGFRTTFDPRGPVTVRVTYLFRCAVPLGRDLLCGGIGSLSPDQAGALLQNGGALHGIVTLAGWRVFALEAERTLPNQGR